MEYVPLDLLAFICSKLPTQAILNFANTSKTLSEALGLNEFWRSLCIRDFYQFLGEQDRATSVDWKSIYIKIYNSRPNWLDPRVKLSFTSTINNCSYIYSYAYDADNRIAFVGGGDAFVTAYHLNAARKFDPLNVRYSTATHKDTKTSAMAVNRSLLAVGTSSGLLLFNKDNQELLRELPLPQEYITKVQFYEDKIIAGTESGNVKVWNIETGTLLESTRDWRESCQALIVNPELNLCINATGSYATVRDARAWSKIGQIYTKDADITCVAINSDKKVALGSRQRTVQQIGELQVYNWLDPKPIFTYKDALWYGKIAAVHIDETKIVHSDPRQINVINAGTFKVTKKAPTIGSASDLSVQSDFVVLRYDGHLGVWSLNQT